VTGRDAKKVDGIENLVPKELIFREDGGFIAISEVNKVYERRSNYSLPNSIASRNSARWVDYYYEDILVHSFEPDGQLSWKKILRKKQYSQDDGALYSSYFRFTNPSHVRLIFNDEIVQNNTVSEYILNSAGREDRKTVLSTDNQKLRLAFSEAYQTSGNAFIVPSERQSKLSLVEVVY
jgi:hypothetical protein